MQEIGLSQQQQMRLRLNPKQVRFGRVLEMSAPEFEDEVRRAIDENPALEEVQPPEAELQTDEAGQEFNESAEDLQRADFANDDEIPSYRLNTPSDPNYEYREPTAVDENVSADELLMAQLTDFELSDNQREITRYVIGNLDSNGYLTRSAEEIADDIAMGAGMYVDVAQVNRAIDIVRSLDPAGIGARDLRDCLLLQLQRLEPVNEAISRATEIVRDRFDLFSRKRFDKIKEVMSLSDEQFAEALRVITSLNPKPASSLETVDSDDRLRHIVPDYNIDVTDDGQVTVQLAGRVPELAIEQSFNIADDASATTSRREREAAAFIRARRDEAAEFIDMAHRRSITLMAVIEAIIRLQPEFFRSFDRADLRPMVLRNIQELTGLDLSVISRATASKYMMTPQGMFALKSLFSEGVGDDGATSSHAIEQAIRAIIAAEDSSNPLSDADICKQLKDKGMDVARRTVAKYRERLGFPIARLRRN